jgi:hypothetical protein
VRSPEGLLTKGTSPPFELAAVAGRVREMPLNPKVQENRECNFLQLVFSVNDLLEVTVERNSAIHGWCWRANEDIEEGETIW